MKEFAKLSHAEMEDHVARHFEHLQKDMPLPSGLGYEFTHTRDGHQELGIRNHDTNEFAVIHIYVDNELLSDESVFLEADEREILNRDADKLSLFMKMMCVHHWDIDVSKMTKQMAVETACLELGYEVELIECSSDESKRMIQRCPDCSSIVAEVEGSTLCPHCGWSRCLE